MKQTCLRSWKVVLLLTSLFVLAACAGSSSDASALQNDASPQSVAMLQDPSMSPVNKGQNRKNDREGDTQLRQNQVDFRDDPPKT
jgi:hypothetical protein